MTAALLVTGAAGGLGSELVARADRPVHGATSASLDITDAAAIARGLDEFRPGFVVNCAAYTAVDAAESDVDRAFAVNARGPELLAAACVSRGVPLVQVSTDYVFAGDAAEPYEPDAPVAPASVYGRSKLAGEQAVLAVDDTWVVRTAWVYGRTGGNFVKTMTRLESSVPGVSVVDDQRGSPTYTADLADGLLELAGAVLAGRAPRRRVLHCTGGGDTTWYGLARAVFTELGADPERVRPCGSVDFPRPAPRPAYSVLSDAAWLAEGLTPLRPWRAALTDYFATVTSSS